jgi:hypothetical protein
LLSREKDAFSEAAVFLGGCRGMAWFVVSLSQVEMDGDGERLTEE